MAGVSIMLEEYEELPYPVRQGLGLVRGWLQEIEMERRQKELQAMTGGKG